MTIDIKSQKTVTRRGILKVIGGGVIVAAAGGGAFLTTRDPAAAREPWQNAGKIQTDPRRKALSYAILAPNPHNRQPWVIDLVGNDEIILYCDKDRHLPVTDPFDRQITIGLGAFVETLVIAASNDGYLADVMVFPEGEPMPMLDDRPVARIRLTKDLSIKPDPLFAQILDRRSNKEAYSDKELPDSAIAPMESIAQHGSKISISNDTARVGRLRQIGLDAMKVEYVTPRTLGESIDLMRIGKAEIIANPDGITIGGPFFDTLSALGQLNKVEMRDPASFAWKTGLDSVLAPLQTGTAYGWLVTNGNSRKDQITAGRDYVRFNLKATELGLAIHPNSQALQEYEEMTELYKIIHDELAILAPGRVQMFVRMGYGEAELPSPKWPLESRIRKV
jgi:hypothetical protein